MTSQIMTSILLKIGKMISVEMSLFNIYPKTFQWT